VLNLRVVKTFFSMVGSSVRILAQFKAAGGECGKRVLTALGC